MESDICEREDVAALCTYAGSETIYKVRDLSWRLMQAGASSEQILERSGAVLSYGIQKNLESLYGERGLAEEDFEKLSASSRGGSNSRAPAGILCFGMQTAIDEQTIPGTNPFYGQRYRLVTCAAGLNVEVSTWLFASQFGAVITHSRFARRVLGVWHLTGADPHICSIARAMGSTTTRCNNFRWNAPVAIAADINFEWLFGSSFDFQPVNARGHAHKLGHTFSTFIGF